MLAKYLLADADKLWETKEISMKLRFIGADHEVTGSCHYLEAAGKKMLVDCGMEQGPEAYLDQDIPVNAAEIDYVFVTHAHIDHSGLIPLLFKKGFRGTIFCTAATLELCNIMLKDSAHIQESDAEWKSRKNIRAGRSSVEPLYDMDDAEGAMSLFKSVPYHDEIHIADGIDVKFIDAGHLLGSSSIEFTLTEDGVTKKIVFSGDIGNKDKPLIKNPEYLEEADYVVMESTYGDRVHENPPLDDFALALAKILLKTFDRGGNVVIPAFSVGRTQEVLYFLRQVKVGEDEKEKVLPKEILEVRERYPHFPVYVDSPLSIEATHVFNENVADCFEQKAIDMVNAGINPIGFEDLHTTVTSQQSQQINFDKTPKVIISASGMCEAGRIRHHLKHNLWNPASSIVFVGYQSPGTLGNILLSDKKPATVKLFGEPVAVNAEIINLPGLSGHADKNGLLTWIKNYKTDVQKVFIVHGDNEVVDPFAKLVTAETGFPAYAPYTEDIFDLITGEQIQVGDVHSVEKKAKKTKANTVFARLVAAGERLMAVIKRSEGRPNKELAKFADRINDMCDKWEK